MYITIELTCYPFSHEPIPIIKDVIEHINEYEGLEVATVATATMITAEYGRAMEALTDLVRWSYEEHGRLVFVAKFLPGVRAL